MRMMNKRPRRDEQGNMVVAVMVIMVLVMLSVAVVARTTAGLKSTRQGQDFTGALANADSGLSDALFRIDQLGSGPATSFCVGNDSHCTLSSVPGAPGVQYTARRVNDNTYNIYSKGVVNKQNHAIFATVTRSYVFPFAIFAKTSLNFNGNTGNYDPTSGVGPVETVDGSGNVTTFPAADVASNGQVTCHGSLSPAHQQDYFKGGGTNCDNAYLLPGNYNPQNPTLSCPAPINIPPTPCLPSPHNPCPAVNGILPASLLSGVYYCNQNDLGAAKTLHFPNTFTVGANTGNNGVVEIYLIPTDNSNITVDITDAVINQNGDPTKLRVYLAGGSVNPGNGMTHSGDFTGVLWAPNANEMNPSCNANWRGALVINTFTCNGGTHLSVHYDTRMQTLVQSSWSVSNYTEIPSNQVTLP
jgi:hypothetical protein